MRPPQAGRRSSSPATTAATSQTTYLRDKTLAHWVAMIRLAELQVEGSWPQGPVLLMTHGTLAHNKMEIMATLQTLFAERGLSSLAISLSLGLDDRTGMYDCATPHRHRHADALGEIGAWLRWLKEQGAEPVSLGVWATDDEDDKIRVWHVEPARPAAC